MAGALVLGGVDVEAGAPGELSLPFLDDEAISAANIMSTIHERGQITGRFSEEYVDCLVSTLNAGPLPARVRETPVTVEEIPPDR